MKDEERDLMRKIILEMLMRGYVHYTDLEKRVISSCHLFATTNTFKGQLRYLLKNGYIRRVERGIYNITEKGKKYLVLLTQ